MPSNTRFATCSAASDPFDRVRRMSLTGRGPLQGERAALRRRVRNIGAHRASVAIRSERGV
jgi:hypothetical protein